MKTSSGPDLKTDDKDSKISSGLEVDIDDRRKKLSEALDFSGVGDLAELVSETVLNSIAGGFPRKDVLCKC